MRVVERSNKEEWLFAVAVAQIFDNALRESVVHKLVYVLETKGMFAWQRVGIDMPLACKSTVVTRVLYKSAKCANGYRVGQRGLILFHTYDRRHISSPHSST